MFVSNISFRFRFTKFIFFKKKKLGSFQMELLNETKKTYICIGLFQTFIIIDCIYIVLIWFLVAWNSLIIGKCSCSVGMNRTPKVVIEVLLPGLYFKSLCNRDGSMTHDGGCSFCHCGESEMSFQDTVKENYRVFCHYYFLFFHRMLKIIFKKIESLLI